MHLHTQRVSRLTVVQEPVRARMCGFGDKVFHFFVNSKHNSDTFAGQKTNYTTSLCTLDNYGC